MNKVQEWREAENLVAAHYASLGYTIIHQNYKISNGELDIVAENDRHRVFIEVKLTNHTTDLYEYITPRKLLTLKRTILNFLRHYHTPKRIRLDIAFVRHNTIFKIYENVTNT